jgi:hypothetical protein
VIAEKDELYFPGIKALWELQTYSARLAHRENDLADARPKMLELKPVSEQDCSKRASLTSFYYPLKT